MNKIDKTVKVSITMRLDDGSQVIESLKPSMYVEHESVPLESLARMCRDKDASCPFGSFGCPFFRSDWIRFHRDERASSDPCPYVTAEDWLEVFESCAKEAKERERKQWEEL